jgi:hypothetical protein
MSDTKSVLRQVYEKLKVKLGREPEIKELADGLLEYQAMQMLDESTLKLKERELKKNPASTKVVQFLDWIDIVARSSVAYRRKIKDAILDGITRFNSRTDSQTKEGLELAKSLRGSEFEEIGFSLNINYVKIDSKQAALLRPIWVHAWATPKILYKHKKLPILVIAGPDLRFNDSIIGEISVNDYREQILGITG